MEIIHFLDDLNQPYSCHAWGEAFSIGIPPIVDDGTINTIFNWFNNPNGSGIYPLIIFLDHTMEIVNIMGSSPSLNVSNIIIEAMLDAIPVDIEGCIDESACNYNLNATETDDSCIYPAENYNCNGNCIAEIDCTGECGGSKIEDECGVCDGYGGCDCADGDISCDCCCPEEKERDCSGVCGGPALDDECGICIDPVCNSLGTPSPFTAGKNPCQLEGEYPISTLWNSTCDFLSLNNISIPNYFKISNLYPNPFNPVLNITFDIAWSGVIRVDILDISGNHIKTLHSGFLKFGSHEMSWNSENLPSGVYFVSLQAGGNSLTSKVVILK